MHKALAKIDVSVMAGIEIGPLYRPIVRKNEGEVYYIDRAFAPELRVLYPQIDPNEIVDVDFVWGSATLADCVGGRLFDYCIASHVVEHVPDLVTWLQEVSEILKIGGRLSLVVPDRRYTFDYFRKESTIAEVAEARSERRRKPNYRQVFDHFANYLDVDAGRLWHDADYSLSIEQPSNLIQAKAAAEETSRMYVDAHCWVFTYNSFQALFKQIIEMENLSLAVESVIEPEIGHNEFFVTLQKLA